MSNALSPVIAEATTAQDVVNDAKDESDRFQVAFLQDVESALENHDFKAGDSSRKFTKRSFPVIITWESEEWNSAVQSVHPKLFNVL